MRSTPRTNLQVILLGALVLSSCSRDERRALEAVRRHAKEPASVEIANLTLGKKLHNGVVLCGVWTAATGYGSMEPWRGFMLLPDQKTALNVPLEWEQDPSGARGSASINCPRFILP
jgi:hypothetical protein